MVFRNPDTVHEPLASYSHQAEVDENARWLILSGQVGMDQEGNIPNDAMEQMNIALANILSNLSAANMNQKNIVKLVFYFVGTHESEQRKHILSGFFGKHKPCMTVLYVAGLANPSLKVEIDAWACST